MADEREEIRARINILDLVGSVVPLKRAGKHFKGLCPFHQDKNPSFYVDPTLGRYKCWSCGEAGDIFTWVMKTQNLDFAGALRELADMAGVTLKGPGSSVPASERQNQRRAMEVALAFFREQLTKSEVALKYCERRDITAETMAEWELGYAPDVGEALASHLKRAGFSLPECRALFLVDQDQSGGYFDRFRGRLMFPIRDERGELVAFGGRLMGDGHPKYINSGDTPLYRKSRVLYGMYRARDSLSKQKQAVLVEGYLDVIACHRAGVTTALASLGTSVTEDHAKLLKRWVEEVVVLYDADAAGQKAANRAVDVLRAEGIRVRVALMPQGEDPDTLLRTSGPLAVQRAVEGGLTPQQYRLLALEQRVGPDQEQFWTEAVEILADSAGDLETEANLVRLAAMYPGTKDVNVAVKALKRMISQARKKLVQEQGGGGRRRGIADEHMALKEPLNAAEFVVFRALHEEKFRQVSWMVILTTELFITSTAIHLSKAIESAFPSAAPEGPIATWLAQLPEHAQVVLGDLLLDFRSENLTEGRLVDSIEWLKRKREERNLLSEISAPSENRLSSQELLERMKKMNPDAKAKKPTDQLF